VALLPSSDRYLPPSEVKVNLTGRHLCHLLTFTTPVCLEMMKIIAEMEIDKLKETF